MEILHSDVEPGVIALLSDVLRDLPGEGTLVPVLIVSSIGKKVEIGLYPTGEDKWRYSLQVGGDPIRLSDLLADKLRQGKRLTLEPKPFSEGSYIVVED